MSDCYRVGFSGALRRHRLLRQYGFTGQLTHAVTVPTGPDGRPGERLLLPSRNAWNGEITPDGARHDCQVILSRRCSLLLVVCLGPVSERGDAWASANFSIDAIVTRLRTRSLESPPERTTLAGEEAVKYVLAERNGRLLHERKFTHDGWLYGAGILVQPGDTAALSLGERALTTWQWQSDVAGEPQEVTKRAVGEVNLTRTIAATAQAVWTVLRTLEGQAAMRAPLVDAFIVPPRPGDLGERFAFVKQQDGCRKTSQVEVLHEEPLRRLVTRDPHSGDDNLRITFDFIELPLRGETNVKATVQYSVSPDRTAALRQRTAADRAAQGTLHRLQTAAEQAYQTQ